MKKTLYEYVETKQKNILLFSEGGMGKSTQLINLFHQLIDKSKEELKYIPMYIDVKSLDYNDIKPIFKYIYSFYFGDLSNTENLDELTIKTLGLDSEDKLTYVFIVDGFNETANKNNIVNDIKKLKKYKCCKFVVSSRVLEEDCIFDDFIKLRFFPLEKSKIFHYIMKNISNNQKNFGDNITESLTEILSNPLFLSTFCKAYDADELLAKIDNTERIRKADILQAYCYKILEEIKERAVTDENNIIEFTIRFFLPRLAYVMVSKNIFTISHVQIIDWIYEESHAIMGETYFRKLLKGKDFNKYIKDFSSNLDIIIEYCMSSSILKYIETLDGYVFSHHIWRDYFASQHIVNLIDACKIDELSYLPEELMIRKFVGELLKKNNLSECDYENKTDCFSDMSPIEHFMQAKHLLLNKDKRVIGNLIEIMKISRNNSITACYDNLDLKFTNFVGCKIQNSTFENSIIYEHNFVVPGHSGYIYSAIFLPDNKTLVSCGKDATIRLWDINKHEQIGGAFRGHDNYVVAIASFDKGKRLVSGSYDKTIRIWDIEEHTSIGEPLIGHSGRVNDVLITPNEKCIISCSNDASIRIWDIEKMEQIGEPLYGHNGGINCLTLSPDGKLIISGGEDGTIQIWDVDSRSQICSPLKGHMCAVKDVKTTSNGKYIVSSDHLGRIFIWDLQTGDMIGDSIKASDESIECLAITKDDRYIVSAGYDGKIRLWDIENRTLSSVVVAHGDWINGIAISYDNNLIVSAGGDQAIKLWGTNSLNRVGNAFIGSNAWINSVKISPDSQRIICGGDDASVRIWNIENRRLQQAPIQGHTARINAIAVFKNNEKFISCGDDGRLLLWSIKNAEKPLLILNGHTSWVRSLCITLDEKYAISGSWDNSICVWNLEDEKLHKRILGHTASVEAIAITNDNKTIVSGSDDGSVRFWDIESGEQIAEPIIAHNSWVRALALTHNNEFIITASWDNTIRVWDFNTHNMICEPLKGHTNRIDDITISKDDKQLLSASDDNTVRSWSLSNNSAGEVLCIHNNAVSAIDSSSNGKFFASGDGDGRIKIFDITSKIPVCDLTQLNMNAYNADFSKVSNKSLVSNELLDVLYQNGCII